MKYLYEYLTTGNIKLKHTTFVSDHIQSNTIACLTTAMRYGVWGEVHLICSKETLSKVFNDPIADVLDLLDIYNMGIYRDSRYNDLLDIRFMKTRSSKMLKQVSRISNFTDIDKYFKATYRRYSRKKFMNKLDKDYILDYLNTNAKY